MSQVLSTYAPQSSGGQSYHDEPLSIIETEAERISAVAKKNWSDGYVGAGIFTMGFILGCAGSGIVNEIAARVEGIAVPKILQLPPILLAVAAVALYALYAVPIIIYKHRGFDP